MSVCYLTKNITLITNKVTFRLNYQLNKKQKNHIKTNNTL